MVVRLSLKEQALDRYQTGVHIFPDSVMETRLSLKQQSEDRYFIWEQFGYVNDFKYIYIKYSHMERNIIIAWFSGLFEGEGSFCIYKNKVKGLSITSTDIDVLEKIKENIGGTIYTEKRKRKENWKQAYIWNLNRLNSRRLIDEIYPFLGSRRKERADYYRTLDLNMGDKTDYTLRNDTILELYKQGKTQGEIGRIYNLDRTSISKIISKTEVLV